MLEEVSDLTISPGDFRIAVDFMSNHQSIELSLIDSGVAYKALGEGKPRAGIIAIIEGEPNKKWRGHSWIVGVADLKRIAAVIPSDTWQWEKRRVLLDANTDKFLTDVSHAKTKTLHIAHEETWSCNPEYRDFVGAAR